MTTDYVLTDGVENATEGEEKETKEPTLEELKAELAEATNKISAAERAAADAIKRAEEEEAKSKYWFDVTQRKFEGKETATKPEEEDDSDLEGVDLNDIVAENKTKKLLEIIDRRAEKKATAIANRLYESKVAESSTLGAYVAKYPDLQDPTSEMFVAVKDEMNKLGTESSYSSVPQTARAELAIQRVALRMAEEGKLGKGKAAEAEPDTTKQEREAQRQAGIAAQAGTAGKRPVKQTNGMATIPPEQMAYIEKMARNMNVKPEAIIKMIPESSARTWRG